MNNISFSQGAIDIISQFEGFVPHPYLDPATHAEPITIGFGSTFYENGTKVTMKDPSITRERAGQILLHYLNKVILPDFQSHIKVDLNQNQLDALACLTYNIGTGGFNSSHVLSDINQHIMNGDLQTRWLAWDKANSKVNEGLLSRRKKEYNYFQTGSLKG